MIPTYRRPMKCTAYGLSFASWRNWLAHRVRIPEREIRQHHGHTARCMTFEEWVKRTLAVLSSGTEEPLQGVSGL